MDLPHLQQSTILPTTFLALPNAIDPYPENIEEAYEGVKNVYERTLAISRMDKSNIVRIEAALNQIQSIAIPFLRGIICEGVGGAHWVAQSVSLLQRLVHSLEQSLSISQAR